MAPWITTSGKVLMEKKIRFSLLPSCGSGQNTSSQSSVEDFVSKLEAFIDEKYPQCSWMLTLNVFEMHFILLNV